MDWIKMFELRFKDRPELQNLKKSHFHGFVQINFSDGIPLNCNCNTHLKAITINEEDNPTLTKGGSNELIH